MDTKVIPVILSGGSGTRMWPLSRSHYPKQFLPLASDQSMLQETITRLPDRDDIAEPMIICNENHRFMVARQLRERGIGTTAIILEPFGRNTAPAATLAALSATNPDDILLVLAADHSIRDRNALATAIHAAVELAMADQLVTFGIVPSAAKTGYGYIRRGKNVGDSAYRVEHFVEKPDKTAAEDFLSSGEFYWNSGMFTFKAGCFLHEIAKHQPAISNHCRQALDNARKDMGFTRIDREVFDRCPSDSIDYAVMEKTSQAVVVPLDAGWNDVGSWSSLWEVSDKDAHGNRIYGDVLAYDSRNNLLHSEKRLVAAVGLENTVVVETPDAVMVAARDRVQDVKQIAEQLKATNRAEAEAHRKVHKPWGWYDCIDAGSRHQVKRICVDPGAKISYQMHHHRAEHWVVIKGTAKITLDGKVFILKEDESTYIPIGCKHRLENEGKLPLEIIEVQTGSYLAEDDIVRFDDDYGREEEA